MGGTQSNQSNPEQNTPNDNNEVSGRPLYHGMTKKRSKIFNIENSQNQSSTLMPLPKINNICSVNSPKNINQPYQNKTNLSTDIQKVKQNQLSYLCKQVKLDLDDYILSYVPTKKVQPEKEQKTNQDPTKPSLRQQTGSQHQESQHIESFIKILSKEDYQPPQELRKLGNPQFITLKDSLHNLSEQELTQINVKFASRTNSDRKQTSKIGLSARGTDHSGLIVSGNTMRSLNATQLKKSTNEMYQIQNLVSRVDL